MVNLADVFDDFAGGLREIFEDLAEQVKDLEKRVDYLESKHA